MADSTSPKGNSGDFAKKVQRRLSRGKEKVLQKLGKAEETRDEQFEHYHQLFSDQQADGNRIHKDLRSYINAVRDMREASRRLSQSLFDAYENDWAGEEDLGSIVEGEDLLWNDYEVKLLDQAVRTMESYSGQFPDVKEKVAKRGRKLVDYDSSRHHLEALQAAKKRDDVKINKAEEEMIYAKSVYESFNNELKEEMPVLYDSRVGCYVAVFSAVSNLRDIFYKEMSTLNIDLQNVIKDLQAQHPEKVFAVKGIQRYGSLRRRTLISPKAWKASFSEFHKSYTPKPGQKFGLRSPDKPRRSTLTREGSTLSREGSTLSREGSTLSRESSTLTVNPQLPSLENPDAESEDLDLESSLSESQTSPAKDQKSGEDSNPEEKEKGEREVKSELEPPAESDVKGDGEEAPASDSSSELNNSCDSESLELQLSAADTGPLHIEEREDSPVILSTLKSNGLENREVSGLNSDTKDLGSPHKDAAADTQTSHDPKSTEV
ncbi:bridging integrator 2a [Platichthys flesus]|uniref:bridging integrator 2a n=1 Tax=Platichthys flesus TaxID=8260 RepID=UPI002DBDF1E7|nr:bridging integrator 2a [Platichthys flesus]XP_062248475.1 bridging integrator 2a [Platichthys flesus]